MARIRTIKPEFWGDEKLAPLAPIHRLVFMGLISLADDAGRLLDNVKQLDGMLFPETPDGCAESLQILDQIEVIERGRTASGQAIIQIVGWKKHQKVDHPKLKAALPPIANGHNGRSSRATAIPADPREPVANDSRESRDDVAPASRVDLRPSTFDQHTSDQRASDPHTRAHEIAALNGGTPAGDPLDLDAFQPTENHRAVAAELRLDVARLLTDWRLHRKANGIAPADLDADFERWIRKEPGFQNGHIASGRPEPESVLQRLPPIPWKPPEEPELTPEERAETVRMAAAQVAALRSDPTPEPRKQRRQLSREEQLAIARGEKP